MDGRPTWTDCDEAGDNVVPNVLSPRDLVSRPDKMDETVPHSVICLFQECSRRFPFRMGFGKYWYCHSRPGDYKTTCILMFNAAEHQTAHKC